MSTKYEYWTGTGGSFDSFYGTSLWNGQSFKPATAHIITSAKFLLKREGSSPSGNLTLMLYATDANSKPTGSPLSSGSIAMSTVPTTQTWVEIALSSGVALTAGVKYALVLECPYGDGVNDICIFFASSATYSGGEAFYTTSGGSAWTVVTTEDYLFEEWGNPATSIKTVLGLARASVKTVNGLSIASVKSIDGLT